MASLKSRLLERIRSEGPIPFEEFHAAALYDREFGFFAAGRLRSAEEGDFLTSPEVSRLFGETLSQFIRAERARLGEPEGFVVVDAGGGSGSLLSPLLAAEPVEAWAVEVSPAAREMLAKVLPPDRVVSSIERLPTPLTGVVIANELIDNLPVAVAARVGGHWRERWVGAEDDDLVLVDANPRPQVVDWCGRFAGPVPEGGLVEVQLAAGEWVGSLLSRLEAGSLLIIDYGDTASGLAPRRSTGTLRTYRAHHLGPDPLDEPGATDVTVDVNFTALVARAREARASTQLLRQEDFLTELGLRDRLRDLRYRELELARTGDEMERLRVRSLRIEAEALLHARGLGDFRVLVAQK
jgi:SAM-dependent MidA family methyltransferase